MNWAFQIGVGLLVANFGDWFIHKYILHGLGKKKDSFFSFHFHDHHNACRKNNNLDAANYRRTIWANNPHAKEFWLLFFGSYAASAPFALAGYWVLAYTIALYAAAYYLLHQLSHGRHHPRLLPWHRRHHMGDQNKNWCVVFPLMDYVFGTRA